MWQKGSVEDMSVSTSTVPVRVPVGARDTLKQVADALNMTMQEVLVRLIAEAENKVFFRKMELAYRNMAEDPELQDQEKRVLGTLNGTSLLDGLEGAWDGKLAEAR
jgi:hypothetical protein